MTIDPIALTYSDSISCVMYFLVIAQLSALSGHICVVSARPAGANVAEGIKPLKRSCYTVLLLPSKMSMDEQIAAAGAGQAPVAEEDLHLAANRDYFNQNAHKYDDRPLAVKIAREVGEFVISKYPFDEEETVLLDFACGTGATHFFLSF